MHIYETVSAGRYRLYRSSDRSKKNEFSKIADTAHMYNPAACAGPGCIRNPPKQKNGNIRTPMATGNVPNFRFLGQIPKNTY